MMHELLKLMQGYKVAQTEGIRTVMATVTAIEGSSYRRPGVRMLVLESGPMIGAVSGGCVEKEIFRQCQSVFQDNKAKIMLYDGRFRLGCEGLLYILLEPFEPEQNLWTALESAMEERATIEIESLYARAPGTRSGLGSVFYIGEENFSFSKTAELDHTLSTYRQLLRPRFHLIIVGSEHDAVQLCYYAFLTGWEVTVVASARDRKTASNFPGASQVRHLLPEESRNLSIDDQTAVVLMTHSYATDLMYLLELKKTKPAYLGLLGPAKRKNRLLNEFTEHTNCYDEEFMEIIYGPSGISIGAETPQEIAISIIAEILAVLRKAEPIPLKCKTGTIHS